MLIQIKEENDILLMYQMTEPCTKITKHGLQSSFLTKMTMRPFKAKGYRAKEVLELVHTDLCGPISTTARGGYEYFITFINQGVDTYT